MAAPQDILVSFSKEQLLKMSKQEGISVPPTSTKATLLKEICPIVEDLAIKKIASSFSKIQLEQIVADAKIDIGDASSTKVVLQKRLGEAVHKAGVRNFFSKHFSTEQLKEVLASVEITSASTTKDALVKEIEESFNIIGMEVFLSHFDVSFLQEVMAQLKLKCTTDSKDKIVYAIATNTAAQKGPSFSKDVEYSSSKQAIKKGITYQDIFQHYFLEEIQEWCRTNGLKVSGSKKDLINRILAYLDGDTENTMASNPAVKKAAPAEKKSPAKKKDSSKEGKKSDKKAEKKSEKASKKAKPEEEEEEEQEEVVEEEEEEEEEEKPVKETKKSKNSKKGSSKSGKKDKKSEEVEEEDD